MLEKAHNFLSSEYFFSFSKKILPLMSNCCESYIVAWCYVICRYYHNITSNTLVVLETMAAHGVKTLIYSSTCATYGEPEKMPITEETPQVPINPYGKAKKMAEDIILDFSKNSNMAVMILRLLVNSLLCVCLGLCACLLFP